MMMIGTDAGPLPDFRRGAGRILLWLLAGEVLLVTLHGTVRALDEVVAWGALNTLLDLDQERSVGTWFSTLQLLAVAGVFAAAAWMGPRGALSRALVLPALAFAFLAADEGLQIHERLGEGGAGWLAGLSFQNGHGTWIPVYAAAGLVLLALTLPAVREVWTRYRAEAMVIVLGFAVMAAGAVGMEAVGHLFLRDGSRDMLYTMEVAAEELLEMAGASVILYGAMRVALRRRASAPAALRAAPAPVPHPTAG